MRFYSPPNFGGEHPPQLEPKDVDSSRVSEVIETAIEEATAAGLLLAGGYLTVTIQLA